MAMILKKIRSSTANASANIENNYEDENEERGNWSGRFDFVLSCIGYAVGLGNLWRFPYLCYENGGGAFLIPYVIMLAFAGLPLFFFELAFGQFANLGPVTIWKISPIFKGIGWSMLVISTITCIYYNVILAWSFHYLFASFTSSLPWSSCNNTWNDYRCASALLSTSNNIENITCNPTNESECYPPESPGEQYWKRSVLGISDYNGNLRTFDSPLGVVKWDLALCLLLSWLVVFLCLIKGVKSSGKVVYFTALFPYFVIICLLCAAARLPGAWLGIKYYMSPNFSRLLEGRVWIKAATQIFYSLGVGFGGLANMASYNRFHNNCFRDAILVSVVNCGTSVLAGFAIFSVIGYMSFKTNLPVPEVVRDGPGLTFVAYPEGITTMPGSVFWAILFFLMLLTLGLDSQFASLEAIFSGLSDEFPFFRSTKWHKLGLTSVGCFLLFLLGLPMVAEGGILWFTLTDDYCASFSLMLVAIAEVMVVCYVYGYKRFLEDIKMMIGFTPNYYWISCWLVLTPLIISIVLIFSIATYSQSQYANIPFPSWALALGWLMVIAGIAPMPVYAIYYGLRYGWSINLLKPTIEWGPCHVKFWNEDPFYQNKLLLLEKYQLTELEAAVENPDCSTNTITMKF